MIRNIFLAAVITILLPVLLLTTTASASPQITQDDEKLDVLARIIYAEARGEPYIGQVAVGAVVLNRVKSPEFPNTILDVIYQPLAFQPVQTGCFYLNPNTNAYKAAREALTGHDPTDGALYFYNPDKVTNPYNWIWSRPVSFRIGNHLFCH